jgi:fructose-1,6-bisphosphatase/inositol monophosphatase family enzyme
MIEEAGGRVTDVWGNDYELATRNLVASNGGTHKVKIQIIYIYRKFCSLSWMSFYF